MLSEAQKELAIRQMEGCRPRFRKGVYGKQYDSHTCSHCGAVVAVHYNYCENCGFRLLWDNPRCLSGKEGD